MYSLKPKSLFIEVLQRSPYSVLLFQLKKKKKRICLDPLVLLTVPDFIRFQEGKQAALASDFSITQFKHLGRLLMVHGRNSYKRSAALSQFVIHRSLCISTMQVGAQPASLHRCARPSLQLADRRWREVLPPLAGQGRACRVECTWQRQRSLFGAWHEVGVT